MPSNVPAPPMLAMPVGTYLMSPRWSRSAPINGPATPDPGNRPGQTTAHADAHQGNHDQDENRRRPPSRDAHALIQRERARDQAAPDIDRQGGIPANYA